MSTCEQTQLLLTDYVDECLSATDKKMVSAHLKNCQHCQAHANQIRTTISAVKAYPGPRAEFWEELDARLDAALETTTRPTPSLYEKFIHWLQPIDQWASVTAGAILTIAVIFMLVTTRPANYDTVAYQKHLLATEQGVSALSSYQPENVIRDEPEGSIHSFAPTTKTLNYFIAGKLYAEAVSYVLVNNPSALEDRLGVLSQYLQNTGQTLGDVRKEISAMEQAILSGQADRALRIAPQMRSRILDSSGDIDEIVFDLGAWTVGFRYLLIMKSIKAERERAIVESFITRIENHGNLQSLVTQLTTIKNILDSTTLNDKDFTDLDSTIMNIEHLLDQT